MKVDPKLKELETYFTNLLKENGHNVEELMPTFSDDVKKGMYALAYYSYENGKYKEAVDIFRVMTLIEPQNPKYWLGLGAALQMLKEYSKALQAYAAAASIDTENPFHHYHAGECLLAMGQKQDAFEALESAEAAAKEESENHNLIPRIALLRETWTNQ